MSSKGLGKGLDSLFDEEMFIEEVIEPVESNAFELEVDQLRPNPYQPRLYFDKKELQQLADSIAQAGIIQPIAVRAYEDHYQIIAGERRWQASKLSGLKKVPVHVLQIPDKQLLEVALLENIHRKELNVIEQAIGLKKLTEEFGHTHEQLAKKVSLNRSTITNLLRLLQLPVELLDMIKKGDLSAGHGRAILGLKKEKEMIQAGIQAFKQGWSVRKTEAYVKHFYDKRKEVKKDPNIRNMEEKLTHHFGLKTDIVFSGKKGRMTLHFSSLSEFDRLMKLMKTEDLG